MDVGEQKTIYLWGLPRSLSTAVLRAMVTVDGCLVSLPVEFTLQLSYRVNVSQSGIKYQQIHKVIFTKLFLCLSLRLSLIGGFVILLLTVLQILHITKM